MASQSGSASNLETGVDGSLTASARIRALVDAGDVEGARRACREAVERGDNDPMLAAWARVLAPPVSRKGGPASGRDRTREFNWLKKNAERYPGCWLALLGEELLSADPDPAKVVDEARSKVPSGGFLLTFEPGPNQCRT